MGLRMVNFKPSGSTAGPGRRDKGRGGRAGGGGETESLQVLVTDIRPGSPAEKAGLEVHDIIVTIGDKPVCEACYCCCCCY